MQTAAHNNHSYSQLHTLQGQHKAGNDKHTDKNINRKTGPSSYAGVTSTNKQSCQQGNESLNIVYETEHIAVKLYNTIHVAQTIKSLKPFCFTEF
jgi:hypothetical protein